MRLRFAAAAVAKLLQSCPTLCDPIDGSPPGSSVPGILLKPETQVWVEDILERIESLGMHPYRIVQLPKIVDIMFRYQIIFAGIFSRISNVFDFVLQGKVTSQS